LYHYFEINLGIHTLWKILRNCAESSYKKLPRKEPELDISTRIYKENDDYNYVTPKCNITILTN
jgi:hypothetical protein